MLLCYSAGIPEPPEGKVEPTILSVTAMIEFSPLDYLLDQWSSTWGLSPTSGA